MHRPGKRHLPRLDRERYRGRAFVHWNMTVERRARGWLSSDCHHQWYRVLLHCGARFRLVCPAYVLMPDHVHLLWLGLVDSASDQRVAVEFLCRYVAPHLAPAQWQRQPYDHVLREDERVHEAFAKVAEYIFENPVRAGLVGHRSAYPYAGCCVPGYPDLDVHSPEYWDLFWRIYNRLVDAT